jgi:hypothetical protein
MNDAVLDSGAAAAPANPAAVQQDTATQDNPIDARFSDSEPEKPAKAPTASEAVKAAQEKLAAKEAAKAKEAESAKKEDEPGKEKKAPEKAEEKVAGKEQQKTVPEAKAPAKDAPEAKAEPGQSEGRERRYEPPARFNEQSKAEWEKAPDSVKAEVHRAIKNLEDGYTKHKEAAERYEQIRQFDENAKANGGDIKELLTKVGTFEQTMKSNPLAALNFALREIGPRGPDGSPITIDDIVAHVHGQSDDQRLQAAHSRIQELESQIQHMETAAKVPDMVAEFAAANERFEELSPLIETLLQEGTAQTLEGAYKIAESIKPVSASPATQQDTLQASPAAETASSAPTAPNPAGQKSISGAPSSGTSSGGKKRILSTTEALKMAMSKAS